MMPPGRVPYEFAPPLTESATIVVVGERRVEHHQLTLQDVVHEQSCRSGSWRTAAAMLSTGLVDASGAR